MTRPVVYLVIASSAIVASLVAAVLLPQRGERGVVVTDACMIARAQVNQASAFSNSYKYRDAYNAVLVGLRANMKCNSEQTKLVNQGYLLSTKAIAEYAFSARADSSADLDRAIKFLQRCRDMPPKLGRTISDLCRKQEQSDIQTRRQLGVRQITFP